MREELGKLRDPHTKVGVHTNRQMQLMRAVDARGRKPQRLTRLTLAQEKVRWDNTLMGFDRTLWDAMHEEELEHKVVDPKEFVRNAENIVICHCDQIPMWLRLGATKQLYKAGEVRRGKRHEGVGRGEMQADDNAMNEVGGQVMECHGEDGMAQMRQYVDGAADRFRVTLEVSQMVHHQFKLGEQPMVRHGIPVLVSPGVHARLSNISNEGTWNEGEVFKVKGRGKAIVRKKGEAVGSIMKSWREMRAGGDADVLAWLQEIDVMQQPAGYCDGIIVAWIQEMRLRQGYT